VGLDLPLPDFTDCRTWPREPNSDWIALTHDGGPARAFDSLMPAFGGALTRDEIEAVLSHVRGFCRDTAWPRGELNFPRALVTEKAFPEDEVVVSSAIATEGEGDTLTKTIYEQRIGSRTQFELILPVAAHSTGSDWTGGVGDVGFAVKRVLHHDGRRGTILSVAGELVLPTGDQAKATGGGVTVFEPFVAFGQALPADGFIQFQGGFGLPSDTDKANNEAFWRTTVGRSFTQGAFGRTWSPMIELVGAREFEDDQSTEWDLVPQMQVTLSTRQHIMLNLGVRVPVSDAGPRPTRLLVYMLWDWFDGRSVRGMVADGHQHHGPRYTVHGTRLFSASRSWRGSSRHFSWASAAARLHPPAPPSPLPPNRRGSAPRRRVSRATTAW
jgi:hypothetical protein